MDNIILFHQWLLGLIEDLALILKVFGFIGLRPWSKLIQLQVWTKLVKKIWKNVLRPNELGLRSVGGQCGEVSGGGSDVIGARCPDIICVSRYIGPGLGKDLSLQPLWRPALSQEAVSTLHSSLLLLVSPYSANNMAKQTSSTNTARMYVILNKWTLFQKKKEILWGGVGKGIFQNCDLIYFTLMTSPWSLKTYNP